MGGVDLLDSLMGRHKIIMKSRKWYMRIFYHLVDLTVVNLWLLYKRVLRAKGIKDSNILNQAKFRAEVACSLSKVGTGPSKRGRPTSLENEIKTKRKRGPTQHLPPQEVRLD